MLSAKKHKDKVSKNRLAAQSIFYSQERQLIYILHNDKMPGNAIIELNLIE